MTTKSARARALLVDHAERCRYSTLAAMIRNGDAVNSIFTVSEAIALIERAEEAGIELAAKAMEEWAAGLIDPLGATAGTLEAAAVDLRRNLIQENRSE